MCIHLKNTVMLDSLWPLTYETKHLLFQGLWARPERPDLRQKHRNQFNPNFVLGSKIAPIDDLEALSQSLDDLSDDDPLTISEQCIGEYSGVTRTLYLERCGEVFWAADRPPKDRTIIRIEPNRVDITIYSALCIIASLGIVLAFSFLIINIKYRKQKWVICFDLITSAITQKRREKID